MDKITLENIALQYMRKHGLVSKGWRLYISNTHMYWGQCDDNRKVIEISAYIAETEPDHKIKDTILHEIAHALVGCKHGHSKVWKDKAREIGCSEVAANSYFSPETEKRIISEKANWAFIVDGLVADWFYRKPRRDPEKLLYDGEYGRVKLERIQRGKEYNLLR